MTIHLDVRPPYMFPMSNLPFSPRSCCAATILLAGGLLGSTPAVSQAPQSHHPTGSPRDSSAVLSVPLTPYPDSTVLAQLAAATQAARRRGRTPIVEIGAPWCGPCHQLEGVLQGPEMREAMQHMYVISLNLDLWQPTLARVGFDVNTGIPRMVVIDSTGRPVGEPWRPRDVPDSLIQQLGGEGAWRMTLTALFAKAQQLFPSSSPRPSSRHSDRPSV